MFPSGAIVRKSSGVFDLDPDDAPQDAKAYVLMPPPSVPIESAPRTSGGLPPPAPVPIKSVPRTGGGKVTGGEKVGGETMAGGQKVAEAATGSQQVAETQTQHLETLDSLELEFDAAAMSQSLDMYDGPLELPNINCS